MKPNQRTVSTTILRQSPILSGLLLTLSVVLLGSLIMAFILRFSGVKETSLPMFSYILNIAALLLGGYISGLRAGQRGWYYGGATGLLYGVILAIVGMLALDIKMTTLTMIHCAAGFGIGCLGGMIGVNRAQ